MMDVAIVGFAQARACERFEGNEIELLQPVVAEAVHDSGLPRKDIALQTLGSNDFLAGQAFAFVRALDATGTFPVADDSHLDMDGAWALYEAWVRLQVGDVKTALVVALGKTSSGRLAEIRPLELDPYYLAPLGLDPHGLAGLQAQALLHAGLMQEQDLLEVTQTNLRLALRNPHALHRPVPESTDLAARPYVASPLRSLDCPPVTDSAAAMVIATADVAREVCADPIWIRGLDHRIDCHSPGARDLTRVPSARIAARAAGLHRGSVDVAELHSCYPHEQLLLARELDLDDGSTTINPSGGPQGSNPVMATGLIRVGEAASALKRGLGQRAVAHATSGPCLQQNLICVLERGHG